MIALCDVCSAKKVLHRRVLMRDIESGGEVLVSAGMRFVCDECEAQHKMGKPSELVRKYLKRNVRP